jgi:alkylation response protein AidB-like acyl-CoA dehydrogenase
VNFFKADLRSIEFTLYEHLRVQDLFEGDGFNDRYKHLTRAECDAVFQQCHRFCNEIVGPLNGPADKVGCRLEGGEVITPDGFKEAWGQLYELGLPAFSVEMEHGGFQGPLCVNVGLGELQCAANTSFNMYPALTHGAMELIAAFSLEENKRRFIEPMNTGRYAGTMCLSEPHAGSDVGAITTKAVPLEGNQYKIYGTKCWISGGDHDMAENIVHMVLARIEGAPAGTKGISLFIVPKYKINDDGSSGPSNDVTTPSIEHKLGIRASTTAVLNFGENDDCVGYLVGGQENAGLKQMFQMMNGARIGVGVQGMSVASAAYLNAVAYARERLQGSSAKAFKNPNAPRVPIIEHADVRRMLMEMKAKVEGMRTLCMKVAFHQDLVHALAGKDDDAVIYHQGQVDLLTPIVKAYCSDQGFRVCELAIQTYGGAGYVEDNPVEQYLRDAKIFSIYEGTNHIQALDLVVRKLQSRGGLDLQDFTGDISRFVESHAKDPAVGSEVRRLGKAGLTLQEAGQSMVEYMMSGKLDQFTLLASPFLEGMSHITVAYLLLQAAIAAEQYRRADEEQSQEEYDFYAGKVASAKFYVNFILPQALAIAEVITSGDRSALDIPDSGFSTAW